MNNNKTHRGKYEGSKTSFWSRLLNWKKRERVYLVKVGVKVGNVSTGVRVRIPADNRHEAKIIAKNKVKESFALTIVSCNREKIQEDKLVSEHGG